MKKYYLLDVGDIVENGDEQYSENETRYPQWYPVAVGFIGEAVQENDPPVRRLAKNLVLDLPTEYNILTLTMEKQ